MKKFFSCITIFLLILLFPTNAFANDSNSNGYVEHSYIVKDDLSATKIEKTYLNENGIIRYLENINKKKPIVGVSYSPDADKYMNAIRVAGGEAVAFPIFTSEEVATAALNSVDALLIPGGLDINPSLYGEEPSLMLGSTNMKRDLSDLSIIKIAVGMDMPVLATCRGMQMLNIFQTGTLIQDIPSEVEQPLIHTGGARHNITIKSKSKLHSIFDLDKMEVNSHHHQAIEQLGTGLTVTALADDGIIEAVELRDKSFVLGIQFHPEKDILEGKMEQVVVYEALLDYAKVYRKKKELANFEKVSIGGNIYYMKSSSTSISASKTKQMFIELDSNRVIMNENVYVEDSLKWGDFPRVELKSISYEFPKRVRKTNVSLKDDRTILIRKNDLKNMEIIYALFSSEAYQNNKINYIGLANNGAYKNSKYLIIDTDNVIDNTVIRCNGALYANEKSYVIDGISYNSEYNKFPFTTEGDYIVTTTLINGFVSEIEFTIDKSTPFTNITSSHYKGNKTITFGDNLSGIKSATLNGNYISNGKTVTAEGVYNLIVKDYAGNSVTNSFVLDKKKPTINISQSYYSDDTKITFSDNLSGVKSATLNGKLISNGKIVSKNGTYQLIVKDNAGNITSKQFILDKVNPKTNITKSYYWENQKITFSDSLSGVKSATLNGKKIDTGNYIKTSGKYILTVKDKAGNITTKEFVLDKIRPKTNIKEKTYLSGKKIEFSDSLSGISKATLNGKKISNEHVVKKVGTYNLIIVDKCGNQKSVTFKIK